MRKEFVSLEIAKELRQIGFDELCIAYYWQPEHPPKLAFVNAKGYFQHYECKNSVLGRDIATPLYQQVINWFRIEHKIHINIREYVFAEGVEYRWSIRNVDPTLMSIGGEPKGYNSSTSKQTYEEALNDAILKTIKLITFKKENGKGICIL